ASLRVLEKSTAAVMHPSSMRILGLETSPTLQVARPTWQRCSLGDGGLFLASKEGDIKTIAAAFKVLSVAASPQAKHVDARTFRGIALFIYCMCVDAQRVVIEQPDTVIPADLYYMYPTQRLRPCDAGDSRITSRSI
ncbi:MAG: hypothetical protein SGPRY_006815, partial [Prymnesium sp.]